MIRHVITYVLAFLTAIMPVQIMASAAEGPTYLPYVFEPIWMSLYDSATETAFFPSKGIFEYEAKEALPGGYVVPPAGGARALPMTFFTQDGMFSEDSSRKIFALIRLKVTNQDTERPFKVFEAGDFQLEGVRGSIFRPHPFTIATTRRLAPSGAAIYLTLGFEVPPGAYNLVFRDTLPNGTKVLAEVWRYDININRTPLYGGLLLLVLIAGAVAGGVAFANQQTRTATPP